MSLLSFDLPPFERDVSRASTLPARAYTDPAIYAGEISRIFARTWQPVGALEDVRDVGSFFTCEVAGRPLVVLRDAAGALRAYYNVCRHRAGPVAIGKGSRKSLTCKYHGWTYGLDGALLTTPELGDAKDFDRACHGLRPVRVAAWGPFVFVNLDAGDEGPTLDALLAPIAAATDRHDIAGVRRVARKDWVIACNWKVYVDNYLEGYHLPTVHPGLFKFFEYDRYRVETHALHSEQIAPMRGADEEALYYWVFPNWMLNVYPDNASINVVVPLGVDRTLTVFEWYRTDPDARDAIARTIAFSEEIQDEDISICEAVQRGLGSGAYDTGRFSPLRENGVHHFQGLVHAWLSESEEARAR